MPKSNLNDLLAVVVAVVTISEIVAFTKETFSPVETSANIATLERFVESKIDTKNWNNLILL